MFATVVLSTILVTFFGAPSSSSPSFIFPEGPPLDNSLTSTHYTHTRGFFFFFRYLSSPHNNNNNNPTSQLQKQQQLQGRLWLLLLLRPSRTHTHSHTRIYLLGMGPPSKMLLSCVLKLLLGASCTVYRLKSLASSCLWFCCCCCCSGPPSYALVNVSRRHFCPRCCTHRRCIFLHLAKRERIFVIEF